MCCRGTSSALNGCINDAQCMMFLLKSRFQFQDSDFRVLTDDQGSPSQWPTKANMFEGFRWLAADARPGDSLVFHFSGMLVAFWHQLPRWMVGVRGLAWFTVVMHTYSCQRYFCCLMRRLESYTICVAAPSGISNDYSSGFVA